jgi:thymidylate synthase
MGLINKLDKQYTELLQTILEHGVDKKDRTGTGTKSIFGYTIRHNMKDGFPLLTTKKMPFKTIITELLWFLRGDTNIKFLVDNNCHIWDGDAYKNYCKIAGGYEEPDYSVHVDDPNENQIRLMTQEELINKIKTDDEFAAEWGELGPIYGKQWRAWNNGYDFTDQIQNLINDLKGNPDSRRLMVNAWNVGELDQMVLPPCHYGFQVYTRELSLDERLDLMRKRTKDGTIDYDNRHHGFLDFHNIPKRAISLMWNQRSVDTFLGLPFNIASYGLLLEILAKEVNMVPDQLIGNLGDVHLYSNHLEQAKEQIGRKYEHEERTELLKQAMGVERYERAVDELMPFGGGLSGYYESYGIPYNTREPYPLPKLNFNTEWWDKPFFEAVKSDAFCKCLLEEDVQLSNYQAHPTIKAPLSN